MKVAFCSLGCKANQYDTESMREKCQKDGSEIVPFSSEADVYVINTCTVTGKSDKEARQIIRRVIRNNPRGKIVVTGCYSQLYPEQLKKIPGINLVLGNREKEDILNYLKTLDGDNGPKVCISDISKVREFGGLNLSDFKTRSRAFIKIQDGCNSGCSYCVVPLARGRNRSQSLEEVCCQIRMFIKKGFKEIVLTGIHLGTYGDDLEGDFNIVKLLKKLIKMKGLFRIRLSSIEPKEITDELIDLLSSSFKICPHLHIPLQSGDDEILVAMNRNYNRKDYLSLIDRLTKRIPLINVGADVMVGFPGEDEKRFLNTYNLIREMPLGYLHVFSFSKRVGTPANYMKGEVSGKVKKERSEALRELGLRKKIEFRQRFIGRELNVLIESKRDRDTGFLRGYTENYIPVLVDSQEHRDGEIISVEMVSADGEKVFGK